MKKLIITMAIHKDLHIEAEIGKDISQEEADEIMNEVANGDIDDVISQILNLANDTHNNGATIINQYSDSSVQITEEEDDKLF